MVIPPVPAREPELKERLVVVSSSYLFFPAATGIRIELNHEKKLKDSAGRQAAFRKGVRASLYAFSYDLSGRMSRTAFLSLSDLTDRGGAGFSGQLRTLASA
jgi:hypothetical protein